MMRKFLYASLAVLALLAPAAAQTMTLAWTNPTTHTNGTPITGALLTQIWQDFTAPGPQPPITVTSQIGTSGSPFKTPQLAAGNYVFTVVNCEAGQVCSAKSNAVSQLIVTVAPNAVTNLTGVLGP